MPIKRFGNIIASILACFLIFISCSNTNNFSYLPAKLGDLDLEKVIRNEKATSIINKMHGKKLDDCKNFIAYYGNNQSKNILYVSVYKDNETAKTSLKSMSMKMANGSPVFSPLKHSKMGENVHFETEGK
jgi:hypothetical protein